MGRLLPVNILMLLDVSSGGSNQAAPCKSFGALRIIPSFYYGEFEAGDMRRDASVTVTGSKGDGNEALLSFTPGSKLDGGNCY